MIRTVRTSAASPDAIHELLVDVDAWSLWSPHVADVRADERRVGPGWVGGTRAFFSPGHTEMVVDEVRPAGGYTWHSAVGPWRLDYDNAVAPSDDGGAGSTVTFTARLSGPAARVIEPLVGRLSARGQRRRMARLSALAELVERRDDADSTASPTRPTRTDILEKETAR